MTCQNDGYFQIVLDTKRRLRFPVAGLAGLHGPFGRTFLLCRDSKTFAPA